MHKDLNGSFCECGAYVGILRKMDNDSLVQKLLTELAISPARMHTIIILDRPIGNDKKIKNPLLSTPKYQELVWVNKAGNFYDLEPQKITALLHYSKQGLKLSQSKYIINPSGFDDRLLSLGKTLCINVPFKWRRSSDLLHYYYEKNYLES